MLGGAEVLLADVVDLERLVEITQHTWHVAGKDGERENERREAKPRTGEC